MLKVHSSVILKPSPYRSYCNEYAQHQNCLSVWVSDNFSILSINSDPTSRTPPTCCDICLIGVGKGEPLPALRTVHAVLPHTALQSVVSSSGSARRHVGFVHGEKPTFSEESIRPSSVVGMGSSRTRMLSLLIQHRPEATTY